MLVGALMVDPEDEVFAITSSGGVIRTSAGEVKLSGRQTMGVRLMNLASGDSVVAIARNAESLADAEGEENGDDAVLADDGADPDIPGSLDDPGTVEPEAGAGTLVLTRRGMILERPGRHPGTGWIARKVTVR